jgi:hypothetical protein
MGPFGRELVVLHIPLFIFGKILCMFGVTPEVWMKDNTCQFMRVKTHFGMSCDAKTSLTLMKLTWHVFLFERSH